MDGSSVWKIKTNLAGILLGKRKYALKYSPKQAEILHYHFIFEIPGFPIGKGELVVSNLWPCRPNETDYILGRNWSSDPPDPELGDGKLPGGKTLLKWRNDILMDWAKR